jgi:hypothetical protein
MHQNKIIWKTKLKAAPFNEKPACGMPFSNAYFGNAVDKCGEILVFCLVGREQNYIDPNGNAYEETWSHYK